MFTSEYLQTLAVEEVWGFSMMSHRHFWYLGYGMAWNGIELYGMACYAKLT